MSPAAAQHVASYDVLLDGQSIAQAHRDRIKELRVVDDLRLPDVCTVTLVYPRGEGVDELPFRIGSDLEVQLGARRSLEPATLFKGRVVTLEPDFGAGGCSVTVRAFDRSHALHQTRRVRTFQNQTSSDIVQSIAQDAGLTAQVEPSGEPHDFVQQDNETDWDFIWRLAERIGFEFVVDDLVARFGRPPETQPIALQWPDTLRAFRPRVSAVQQVQEVSLRAHDPKTKQVIESRAQTPSANGTIGLGWGEVVSAFQDGEFHIATEPVKSSAEGDALTQAVMDRLAHAYVSAVGVTAGDPRIRTGATLAVTGVGERFGGTYHVARSTHVLRGGGAYETQFTNVAAQTMSAALGSGGDPSPRFGAQLVLGLVTNNDDPDRMGRVRVNYPALGEDVEGAWARVVTPHAGSRRGLLMLPQVGDEVLLGFEHDDTTRPYVLGSLFNGRDGPEELVHDSDGSFCLHSGAAIVVESDDVASLKTAKDLTIEAGGPLKLTADDAADVNVTRALSAGASEVTVKAQTSLTLEATTTLTLKCAGAEIELSPAGARISAPTITLG